MQRNSDIGEGHGKASELKAFKALLGISFAVHILVFWVDPSQWFMRERPPLAPEWEIATELVFSGVAAHTSLPAAVPVKEPEPKPEPPPPPPPEKELLPQLPKKFAMQEEEAPAPAAPSETVPEPAKPEPPPKPIVAEAPEKPAPPPPAKPVEDKPEVEKPSEQLAIKKDDEATKLFKKDLMERLLREKARQEAQRRKRDKQKEKERQLLADRVAALKREASSGAASNATIDDAHPYILAVKGYINANYSVPEVYNFEETAPPIVMFMVNGNGDLMENDLYQASGNAALDQYALKSIVEAAPFFPKPPPEIVGRPIQIRFQRNL